MRPLPPTSPDSPLSLPLWFAVLGAPLGWTLQFSVGYWLVEAQCSRTGQARWAIDVDLWMAALTALGAAAALGAGLTALALFRRSREAGHDSAPPAGRIHFLAMVGMAVAPLFLAMIALTAIGVFVHFPPCEQS
jgi:hypothetical protein